MNVLLVEDDDRISEFLAKSLKSVQFSVTHCRNVEEVKALILQQDEEFDMALLDRMLGNDDGGSLIKPLKKRWPHIGVIVLSSLDNPNEKAKFLDLGVDDYVGKPFSLEELIARLRNVYRRVSQSSSEFKNTLVVKDLQVDLTTQQCWVHGKLLSFTKKELQLLMILMQKPGRIYSKEQILSKVWNVEYSVESNVVESTVKNLRKKLQDAGSEANILSKRNMGYWIEE